MCMYTCTVFTCTISRHFFVSLPLSQTQYFRSDCTVIKFQQNHIYKKNFGTSWITLTSPRQINHESKLSESTFLLLNPGNKFVVT